MKMAIHSKRTMNYGIYLKNYDENMLYYAFVLEL
jgi:hypothetical protein